MGLSRTSHSACVSFSYSIFRQLSCFMLTREIARHKAYFHKHMSAFFFFLFLIVIFMSLKFNQAILSLPQPFDLPHHMAELCCTINFWSVCLKTSRVYNVGFLIASPYVNTWKGVAHARTGATLPSFRCSAHSCLCVMDRDIFRKPFMLGAMELVRHGWMCET